MIEMRGVSKSFGRVRVLDALDLSLRPGRITAVVGPNAAGKTTLIRILLGLVHADAGEITLDGAPLAADGSSRGRIGYMPQIARFPENLMARELLELVTSLRENPPVVDRSLLDAFGLEPELVQPLRTLSGGTRQKVNAALALLFAPDVLVLDEPTAGLDPVSSGILKDRILEERARGRTVLITSHIMSELEELADDVAFLVDGRIRFAGPVAELKARTRQANLERAIAHLMIREAA